MYIPPFTRHWLRNNGSLHRFRGGSFATFKRRGVLTSRHSARSDDGKAALGTCRRLL
jgi:hypothetical protein